MSRSGSLRNAHCSLFCPDVPTYQMYFKGSQERRTFKKICVIHENMASKGCVKNFTSFLENSTGSCKLSALTSFASTYPRPFTRTHNALLHTCYILEHSGRYTHRIDIWPSSLLSYLAMHLPRVECHINYLSPDEISSHFHGCALIQSVKAE